METSISGAGVATEWLDLQGSVSDVGFAIVGTWVGTIAIESSDQEAYAKDRITEVETHTANTGRRRLPRDIGSFVRFRFTAWTSGTAFIQFTRAVGPNNELFELSGQKRDF